MPFKAIVIKTPVLGRLYLIIVRLLTVLNYYRRPVVHIVRWLIRSRETTNFTYDLDALNKQYLAAFIASALNKSRREILGYLHEIDTDEHLRRHIRHLILSCNRRHTADAVARYGRRIGWYAMVRALKPRVIVETGVDKGLGSCVLTAALKKNDEQGHHGFYYGIDIHPRAGFLLSGEYAEFGCIIHGDAVKTLQEMSGSIDLLISDSDHSPDYETAEYEAVSPIMNPGGVILSDNAHACDALLQYAERTGRRFSFFQEKPADHWYPGAGIGIAYNRDFSGPEKISERTRAITAEPDPIQSINRKSFHQTTSRKIS